jgi:hypothetical protein
MDGGGSMSRSSRLRGEEGFIREVIWIVVILGVIAVVVLDGIALFNAYQSAETSSGDAAEAAVTEYAQSVDVGAAKLAATERLQKNGLELVKFSAVKTPRGTVKITVTAKATADTYAFRYLSVVPQLKDWVKRTTHPVRSSSAE